MSFSPSAKRIRRSEVFDEQVSASPSSDEEIIETATIKQIQDSIGLAYHFDYDIIENNTGRVTKVAHLQVDEPIPHVQNPSPEEDHAFEFRLFSAPHLPPTVPDDHTEHSARYPPARPTRFNIRSPTPDVPSSGHFLHPHRPRSYHFNPDVAPKSIALSAISGRSVLLNASLPWHGCFLPWRVTHLPSPSSSSKGHHQTLLPKISTTNTTTALSHLSHHNRKPSKKRRIQVRTRSKLLDARAKEKETHLREKKTRLNRERKVKRREKERKEKKSKEEKSKEEKTGGSGDLVKISA